MSSLSLDALLALQDTDTAIAQSRHRRDVVPEALAMAANKVRLGALAAEIGRAEVRRDEVAKVQDDAETELSATETRAGDVSKRLYGGSVSASRELSAMAADVESLKSRASGLEERVLQLMDEREPLEAHLGALVFERDGLEAANRQLEVDLGAAAALLDSEIAELEEQRATRAAMVPDAILSAYDRLRARLNGVGAARLVAGRCSGCHLSIPATELDRIRHHPDELAYCEQCGRILVG